MRAERIDSSLHPRTWSFNRQPENAARQLVLVLDGAGEAEAGNGRLALTAPALMWLGDLKPGRLRLQAGATGYRGWISGGLMIEAIGDQPESVELRYLADRNFVLSLAGHDEQAGRLERCFKAVLGETSQPGEASPLMLSALARIMLVAMLRVSGGEEQALPGIGERAGLLQRFRQQVEMNFRSHWPIARYAEALGVTTDRLHAICTSATGKPPKALVSERLAEEAARRLERSSITIQQLAHSLGFNDPAHFSSFFKRVVGMPPGQYRALVAQSRARGQEAPPRRFSDWP